MVGLDEVLDELVEFSGLQAKEFDGVGTIFFGDGGVDVVFLNKTTDLVKLVFGAGLGGSVHIDAVLCLQHNIDIFCRKFKNDSIFLILKLLNHIKFAPALGLLEGFFAAFGHIEPVVPVGGPACGLLFFFVEHLHFALGWVGEVHIE